MFIYPAQRALAALVAVCTLTIVCSFTAPAFATMGQAIWVDTVPEDVEFDVAPLATREQARMKAFGQAVLEEAVDMLPGELTDARVVLLSEYLAPRANDYVLSYSVVSVEELELGKRLTVDVTVNRSALKKALKRLGIWFTITEPVSYNPQYGSIPGEVWEKLGRMHVLYGLTPNSSARLSLQMDLIGKEWRMKLTKADEDGNSIVTAESVGDSFDEAWHAAWGRYFAGVSSARTGGPTVVLAVEGWFAPDGVEAFDRTLQGWEGVLDEANLVQVVMKAAGVSASWNLVVVNRTALESKLASALAGRGLAYELQEPSE